MIVIATTMPTIPSLKFESLPLAQLSSSLPSPQSLTPLQRDDSDMHILELLQWKLPMPLHIAITQQI